MFKQYVNNISAIESRSPSRVQRSILTQRKCATDRDFIQRSKTFRARSASFLILYIFAHASSILFIPLYSRGSSQRNNGYFRREELARGFMNRHRKKSRSILVVAVIFPRYSRSVNATTGFPRTPNNLLNNNTKVTATFKGFTKLHFCRRGPLRDDVAARATIFVIKIDSSLAITRVIFRNDCPLLCSNCAVHRHKVGID